jgi:hypothetical protein
VGVTSPRDFWRARHGAVFGIKPWEMGDLQIVEAWQMVMHNG